MRNINTFLLCVYWMNYGITAIQLLGCGSNGLAEVSEKSNFTLTCDGFDAKDNISWQGENNEGGSPFPAGTCPCCACSNTFKDLPVSRTTATVSQLTVMSSRTWDNYRFTCFITGSPSQKSSCLIHAMYPAEVTSCSVVVNNGSWTIGGSCTISKVFTSSNIYKCIWYRGTSQMSQTTLITTTTYTPVNHSDPNYRQGTCTFTLAFDLPLVTGSYYYKVVVDPGGTEKQFGPLDIERPFEPTIVCTPSPYVQENTNIKCDCKTTNVGKPSGYLSWSRESDGKVNIINNGSYSGTSLTMNPQVLNASDHSTTVLQCTLVWMNTAIKGGLYRANVSYMDAPKLSINSRSSFTVSENQPVNFICNANGNPVPTLNLSNSNNNKPLSIMSSPLNYSVSSVRCEDTANYTCFASNSLGKNIQSSASLFVNCKPRIIPGLTTPQELSPVMYMNKSEQQVFTVAAYPSPNTYSFLFLGSDRNLTTISDTKPTNIYLNVTCVATQRVYLSMCILTVDNVISSDVGFYQVTIGNTFGSENFTFEVRISAGKDGDNPGNDPKINSAAIGGGIAAGVAVIVIIIVVITIILKRRNEGKKDSGQLGFKDKSPLHSHLKDDNDPECSKIPADVSGINYAFSPEPQQIESLPKSSSPTDKQGIVKKVEPPTEENQSANHPRGISNLPLLMQPPVMHPGTKPKHDQTKRKKGKKSEGRKDCKDCEYENVSLPAQTSAEDTKRKAHQNKNKNAESHINNEGITYMELDFSQSKGNKIVKPPPAEEHVEYAPIDFSKQVS